MTPCNQRMGLSKIDGRWLHATSHLSYSSIYLPYIWPIACSGVRCNAVYEFTYTYALARTFIVSMLLAYFAPPTQLFHNLVLIMSVSPSGRIASPQSVAQSVASGAPIYQLERQTYTMISSDRSNFCYFLDANCPAENHLISASRPIYNVGVKFWISILIYERNNEIKESRAVARKPRDSTAVVFGLKFADNIHCKFKSSQASKARLQSSKHTGAKQNLTQKWQFQVTCFGVSGKAIRG